MHFMNKELTCRIREDLLRVMVKDGCSRENR